MGQIRDRRGTTRRLCGAALGLTLVAAAACSRSDDVTTGDGDEDDPPAAGTDAPTDDDGDDGDDVGDEVSAPVIGGHLVVGGEAEVGEAWTPANVRCDSPCYQRALTFFDTLTVIDENGDWQPFLAESMEPNEDFTEWTVTLRDGITFHDGEPFDADAAIFNLNQHATSLLTAAALHDLARNPDNPEEEFALEKVDDLTFTIFTGRGGDLDDPRPWPGLPYAFTKQAGFMGSPTWLQDVTDGGDPTQAVGTGPFMIETYRPDDRMTVVRNPDYWLTDDDGQQLPYLDSIEFVILSDDQARRAAIESNEIDMVAEAEGNNVSALLDNPALITEQQSEYTETSHILLHVGKDGGTPLADREVRCALVQGLDRDELVSQRTGDTFERADGLFSPGQQGYLDDTGLPEYDPDAARDAIEAYEADNGPVVINYTTTAATSTQRQAEYVQQQWEAIGVEVNIETVLQAELITNAAVGADMFDAFGWRNHGGLFVEQQYFWWHSHNADTEPIGLNFGRIRDDVIDENLEAARTDGAGEAAQEAAETINRRIAEECYVVPLWHVEWGVARDTDVDGLGRLQTPDGDVTVADGAGFPGQVWFTTVFVND